MTKEEFLELIFTEIGYVRDSEHWARLYDDLTTPHWISVEDDGNPIDTGWYIFTTGKIVDVGYYLGGNEWRDVHPTHWMPLPQAPVLSNLENTVKDLKGGKDE